MEVNLNSARCLKTMTNIGYDTVHNVCTNTVTIVPWGVIDWFENVIALLFMLAIACALIAGLVIYFALLNQRARWQRKFEAR